MDTLLYPLEWFVAAIMVGWHKLLTLVGMPADSGWTWAFSIAGLVIILRIMLIPLFVKQIHSSRRMQLIQPEMQKIQKKYKGKKDPESRQRQQEEMMELYRTTGTNPMGSCMPIILQAPFFYSLYRVLRAIPHVAAGSSAHGGRGPIGFLTQSLAQQADGAKLFGAQISQTFMGTHGWGAAKWLSIVLIVLMSTTSFYTQHQLMRKNMPPAALEGPMAQTQKIMIYGMPLFFLFTGVNFPIGVLLYWLTTNLWTAGQQYFVIRRMPTPGSEAEKKLEERNRARGREHKKMTMDDLRRQNEGKPKGRFQQAMERAQEQARNQGGASPAGSTQSGGRAKGAKRGSSPVEGEASEASTTVVESEVVSPVREHGDRAPKNGPRNQPKKNTPRAKRKKK